MENLKEILIQKVDGLKSIQPKSSRFDDIREELLKFDFQSLHETIWNILNDFPKITCKECGYVPQFKSFQYGYKQFCNISCSNKFKGRDKEINERISKSVSKFNSSAPKEFWDKRTTTHRNTLKNQSEELKIKKKNDKSKLLKKIHENRSTEDRKKLNEKISYSVKNSKRAQRQRMERAKLGAKALNEYRKILKSEELKEFNKRFGSKDLIGEQRKEFKEYYKLVWFFTNQELHLLENIEKRSIYFHLDHKFSIKEGFLNNISPEIIGSNFNLEIIEAKENISKGSKCSITKEELLSSFHDS